ncbi:hypothetical protein FGE12_26115 [Aggregicoccus sp. 17bor-14]|uniref:hypothetical protein n=1 Tax=Myxococcaceae TaxID=31 RepID=UPI00129CD92A|nr:MULTISPECIES: hypothetical protein [Myxococcaceae]MBF5045913.1 hypothetical protein [Simulacricoccus sp. 17bor-14]MRI91647.1 hypothetical protein [Aggregicoccus sp. 17bor-14]
MTSVLALKLLLAPGLVTAASLAGRRWGPEVAGWLAGFPMIAGPIALFFALEQGALFGAHSARGTLAGIASLTAYTVVYGHAARRGRWPGALAAGYAAFLAGTALLHALPALSAGAALLLALASLELGLRALPRPAEAAPAAAAPGRWDLPVRAGATLALVLGLTALAARLGPGLSGLLAPFPVASAVLTAFAHQQQGPEAALRLLRGVLRALRAFAAFFAVLALALEPLGIPLAFAAALLTAGAVQALGMLATGRAPAPAPLALPTRGE